MGNMCFKHVKQIKDGRDSQSDEPIILQNEKEKVKTVDISNYENLKNESLNESIINQTIEDFENNNNNEKDDLKIEGSFKITGSQSNIENFFNSLNNHNSGKAKTINLTDIYSKNNISFFNLNVEKVEKCYTFIRKIGKGAFGKCYLVQLKKGNQDVRYAIKSIGLDTIDKDKLILLKTEISCLKKLIHPNIVHFFQLFYNEENIHMVMEPCLNGSLFDKLVAKKRFSEKEAIKIMLCLLSAINYCHKNKIIHRDIKPENILLVNSASNKEEFEFELRLIDFGLSHIYSKKDQNSILNSSVGSPYFMAPEVLNEYYNSKCDIWSLGVLFYFLIAGIPPFYSDSIPDLFKLIISCEPSFKGELWNKISSETKTAIKEMLIKDYKKRPSADDVLKLECFKTEIDKICSYSELENHENLIKGIFNYFNNKNNFIAEICIIMTSQLTSSDFRKATSIFNILDNKKDGFITPEILIKYSKEKQIDVNSLKNIEFITYSNILESLCYKKFFNPEYSKIAFSTFDNDNDGFISYNDFSKTIFKSASKFSQNDIDIVLVDAKCDRKMKLSYNDFFNIMTKTKDKNQVFISN